ncbi:hypothetical protein PYCC9005_005368 [Savitreella phatthalungensis]
MIDHELQPGTIVDPALVDVATPQGSLYLDGSMRFWSHPSRYDCPRGGILGEELGTGKTCESIALILATMGDTAEVPVGTIEISPEACRSLTAHLAKQINVSRLPWITDSDAFSPGVVALLEKHRVRYEIPRATRALRARAVSSVLPGKIMYISHATLIVVPDTLVAQWRHELSKHATDILRVLVLALAADKMPAPQTLLAYDLVLISHSRFAREEEHQALPAHPCKCPYLGNTREIDCTCPPPATYISPLSSIHWLRLMVDEGHTMATRSTKAVRFASQLTTDRRWIISGTPSKGIMGTDLEYSPKLERQDLDRLGLLCEFLGLPLDRSVWRASITAPFLRRLPGSERAVRGLLAAILVRNRHDEIEVRLPPLTRSVVLLTPTEEDCLSQNLFSALVAVNAVTSQRVDQDYLFDKRNAAPLAKLVRNLLVSTFWWTGTTQKDVEAALDVARKALGKFGEDALLLSAIGAFEAALASDLWRACSDRHECPYFVEMPSEYSLASGVSGGTDLLNARRALEQADPPPEGVEVQEWIEDELAQAAALSFTKRKPASATVTAESTAESELPSPLCSRTGSAKLNYLIDALRSTTEKCLVFTEFVDHAYHLAEALDVCHIPHLIYVPGLSSALKSRYVADFNNTQDYQVMILDTQLAAHGLNLSTATRVFFVQQFWSPAVERQAVARAHRIGQVSPVHAEVLVLKGSLEDVMHRRRVKMSGSQLVADTRTAAEDSVIRSHVQQAQMLSGTNRPLQTPIEVFRGVRLKKARQEESST